MKKLLFLLALSLCSIGAMAYDFSAVAPTGQTLYYNITSSSPYTVSVTYATSYYQTGALTIPSTVIHNGTTYSVTSIGSSAFDGCSGLTSVTIPHNVQSIGSRAFANCSQLATVNFNADSCTYMGGYSSNCAFSGCTALSTLNIGENVKAIPDYAFYGTGITSVTIPHNVKSIGDRAFANCSQLTTVNFNADSCTYMGYDYDWAFYNCSALTTVNIGDNVKVIPDYAFSGIEITSVTIPHNVKSIGRRAFADCTQLTTVNYNADSCTYMGDYQNVAFYGCTALTTVNIGDNVIHLPDYSFSAGNKMGIVTNLFTVNFGNNVQSIGRYAFFRRSALSTIELPASLERIGKYAFSESDLTSIVIPQQVSVIDTGLFNMCSDLTSVVLPDSLEEIKYDAFSSCSALDSIIIPNSVSSIGSEAFYDCGSLSSITIPSAVTLMGSYAFYGCTSLQRITMLNEEPPTIASNTFMDVPTNVPIFVPCGATDNYRNAGFWSNFINYNEDESCFLTLSLNCNNAMMGTLMGAGRYPNNSNVTIAAVPYTGYQFLGWNDGNTTNPRTIQVSVDTSFTATFAAVAEPLALHNVTVMSSNTSMGNAVGSGVYQEGCSLSIVALPNSGYAFSAWHDGNTENPRNVLVNSDGYYIASFVSAPISSDTILVHDTTIVHDTTFVPVHDTTIVHDTTFVPVHDTTIVYDTTFVPVHDTTIVHDTTYITVTDTIVQPITYYELSVISANVSQGLVAGNGHFPEGTMVEIAAIPMEGYRFRQWSDGNTDNPRVVEVSGDATYEALFETGTQAIGNVDNQEYSITTDNGSITIQGAAHQRIRIFDCLGRLLTTEMNLAEYKTFMVPASGAYMVQVGNSPAKRVVVIR